MVRAGRSSARLTTRARILLQTDDGWPPPEAAQALDMALGAVFNVKRRFAEGGLEGTLKDRPQDYWYRKMDDRAEAHLIALACSPLSTVSRTFSHFLMPTPTLLGWTLP